MLLIEKAGDEEGERIEKRMGKKAGGSQRQVGQVRKRQAQAGEGLI